MMKPKKIGRRDPKHSALSRSTCKRKHHVDDTTANEAIIMGLAFIPVYALVLVGCWLGWF